MGARISPKFAPRFYGPLQVLEGVGAVTYRIQLPPSACIHPIYHVSLLKKVVGKYRVEPELPQGLEGDAANPQEPAATVLVTMLFPRMVKLWVSYWYNGRLKLWIGLPEKRSSIFKANCSSSDLRTSLLFNKWAMVGPYPSHWALMGCYCSSHLGPRNGGFISGEIGREWERMLRSQREEWNDLYGRRI